MDIPDFITLKEYRELIDHIKKLEKEAKSKSRKERIRKYKVAIILGFESGLRVSEIVGLAKLYSKCCKCPLKFGTELRNGKMYITYSCGKCKNRLKLNKETYRPSNNDWKIKPLEKKDIKDTHIRVENGKGGKSRVTRRPKNWNKSLERHLPLKDISRRSLQKFFKEISKEVLKKDLHFHILRHSFGSRLAGGEVPLHEIQMMMGHTRLDTTGIYLHANPQSAVKHSDPLF